MRGRPIKPPAMQPPYYRAERLAAELNVSAPTFHRWSRELGFTKCRRGRARGGKSSFVWFHWGDVRQRLIAAGFSDLPDLPFRAPVGDHEALSTLPLTWADRSEDRAVHDNLGSLAALSPEASA